MNLNENFKSKIPTYQTKITSLMDIHRQRFSQINQKFKQRSIINPIIIPQSSRPQPRQQARIKQQIPLNRQSNISFVQNSNQQYITLANLSKILHAFQTPEKLIDNYDTATDSSSSTTNSNKQRVQQHLQQTATRWWKSARTPDHIISNIHTSDIINTNQNDNIQLQTNLPLITIVSNSTRQFNVSLKSKYDESEVSTEVPIRNLIPQNKITRQEPLIMQARGMHVHSYDQRLYNNQNKMNFFQQQRLIRQT